MLSLAAFADEISPDLSEQARVCRQCGISHIELRSAEGKNVLDFDADLRRKALSTFKEAGLTIGCIGSPIGKVKITDPWPEHFDRFKTAVDVATEMDCPLIRIFSYYPPDGGDILQFREQVLERMHAKLQYIASMPITLVHENEHAIYGQNGGECLDLMKSVNHPQMRMAFDFANFVQAKQHPLDQWPLLKPYTTHIHIKDAMWADGRVVPAGQGDGQLEPILADAYKSGYRGLLSLEPHLAAHGQFSGFSGPKLFKTAAEALKALCGKLEIPLAGV